MKSRILLGTPTFDSKAYCLEFWVRSVREIQNVTPCDVLIVDNSPDDHYALSMEKLGLKVLRSPAYDEPVKSIGEARRKLYAHALEHGYDYIFSLEQDVFPPPDILKRLLELRNSLAVESAVVAAPYTIKYLSEAQPPYRSIGRLTSVAKSMEYSSVEGRPVQALMTLADIAKDPGVHRVFSAGLGCALFDVPLLKKIEIRYSQETLHADDAFFYQDCEKLGIPVYVDTRLVDKVIHISGNVHSIFGWWSMASSVKHRRSKPAGN